MKTVKMMVCDWYGHIYPYDVKTTGKHPIHMIEGGKYITEDMRPTSPSSDMGCFYLNSRDYDWFKNNLIEVEIKIEGENN